MKKMTQRQQRVSSMIMGELTKAISRGGFTSPLITGMITIPEVWISPDMRICKVFFSSLDKDIDCKKVTEALNSDRHIFQKALLKLEMKHTPKIKFYRDTQQDEVARIEALMRNNDE